MQTLAFTPLYGSGVVDTVKKYVPIVRKIHDAAKEHRIVSRALRLYGNMANSETAKKYAEKAHQAGYRKRRRGQKGRGKTAAALVRSAAVKW